MNTSRRPSPVLVACLVVLAIGFAAQVAGGLWGLGYATGAEVILPAAMIVVGCAGLGAVTYAVAVKAY